MYVFDIIRSNAVNDHQLTRHLLMILSLLCIKQQLQYQISLLYISRAPMKNQPKYFSEQRQAKNKQTANPNQFIVNTKPIKSPSPDSKPCNIIAYTRSPALQEIKKQITPIKQQPTALKILQKIEFREKFNPTDFTPKNQKNQQHNQESNKKYFKGISKEEQGTTLKQQNRARNQSQSITQNNHYKSSRSEESPSEFELRFSSRLKENFQSKTGELDYLRLLKQKEQTIKQLRDLLQLIDKSNSGEYEQDQRVKILQRKLKEYSKQVKVLQIENQCLISVIQNNHVNIPSNKQQILQREIRELRESLFIAEKANEEQLQRYKERAEGLQSQNKKLESECDKLLKLMKERENCDKRQGSGSTVGNSLVVKDRERITLSKIREQYNQNLKLAKQNFENQYRDCYQSFQKIIEKESRRLDFMNHRIQQLQQALSDSKQNPPIRKSKEYKQHQQIQSLLFQKYTKYMKELDEQKKVNQKLNLQLSIAWKSLRELQIKSFNSSQDMHNESQNQQISQLSSRNTLLKNKIKELQAVNLTLSKQLQTIKQSKSSQTKVLQQKIETIVNVYEQRLRSEKSLYQQKYNELQMLKKQIAQTQERHQKESFEHQSLIEQKISQIIQTYEKEAEIYKDNLLQKFRSIQSLQEENQHLRNQIEGYMNTNQKQTVTSKQSQNERVVESLQFDLRQLKIRLREDDQFITILKESKQQIEEENQCLRKQISQMKQSAFDFHAALNESKLQLEQLSQRMKESQQLKEQNQLLHSQLQMKRKEIVTLVNQLNNSKKENEEIARYLSQFKLTNLTLNSHNLQEELKLLKRSIVQFFIKYKQQAGTKTLQNYYTIETLYEQKIDENMKLHQLLEQQKDKLNRQKQQKSRLNQKISNLQKNIIIYQQQLKERKVLYQGLLRQKSRIQKQILLSKKIKQSKNLEQGSSENVNEITNQIDRIVEFQKKRNQNLISFFQQKQRSL